jgi:hypothetical protein
MHLACRNPLPAFLGCEIPRKGQLPVPQWIAWVGTRPGWADGRDGSVAGNVGIDGAGPAFDATGERLDVLKPLVSKPHGDREGTGAVMTEDDDRLVWIELLMRARGYFTHGHEQRVGEGGGVEFPRLTDVQEEGRVRLLTLLGKDLCRDFGLKHDIKDNVGTKGK